MRDDQEWLTDILTAIDRIFSKTTRGRSAFLQIVGEAARCLSDNFRQLYPDDVWSKAAGMRNILVHHYFEIDAQQIWKVVEHDLPPLRKRVQAIIASQRSGE